MHKHSILFPYTERFAMTKLQKQRAKQRQEVRAEREKMLSKYKTRYDDCKDTLKVKRESSTVIRFDCTQIPSLNTFIGSTERRENKTYTGTKLVGIATMHKSNMVPVFSQEEAEQISKMRRN